MAPAELIPSPAQAVDRVHADDSADAGRPPSGNVLEQATAVVGVRPQLPEELEAWCKLWRERFAAPELLRDLHRSNPKAAERLAEAMTRMPGAGTEFLGFHLEAELGRGAVGRVFLARQRDVADRRVVLKISPDVDGELRNLAQLQHANVVPIHSVHRAGPLQAVCMPYLGSTTLANILDNIEGLAALPESGKGLVSTLVKRLSTSRRTGDTSSLSEYPRAAASPGTAAAEPPVSAAPQPQLPAGPIPILEMLQGLSYVEAVLWIGTRLADGLAHAHERGILHRDLKPANILLTDDGQPMLLDFNLSQDTKPGSSEWALVGGTLPFMAPEQLKAYGEQTCVLSFTSDLYALGVILFQLLTGRHPFDTHTGPMPEVLERMVADRRETPPRLRRWNPAVSPAVESIVRHCLEPDPARRYQSARTLQEDLQRQLEDLPLKHAPEPSLRERARKWTRRHPRLASGTSVAALAGVVVVAMVLALLGNYRSAERQHASRGFDRFREEKKHVQFFLAARPGDAAQPDRGLELCKQLLDSYQVLENSSWQELPAVRNLGPDDQALLRDQVGELLFFYAQATALRVWDQPDSPARAERLRFALLVNERAESCYPPDAPPRALLTQRAEILTLLHRTEEARTTRNRAEQLAFQTARDHYLFASEQMIQGRLREALPHLKEATAQGPQDFWAWFLLGLCQYELARNAEAAACYSTCIALWPQLPWPHYNRGLAHLRQLDYQQARADFDQAILLRPENAEMRVQRALAKQGLKQYPQAIEDFDSALKLGADPGRIYLLRAETKRRAGDVEGAKRDYDTGLLREPTDAQGWLARGFARMTGEPAAALADLDRALRLEPRSLPGLQNKANLLSRLGRTEEAAATLNRAVELYPEFVFARAGRGVMLARLGRRDAALLDAAECLRRDGQPLLLYQLAGIYALTSREYPEDKAVALRLLGNALLRGCGFDLLDQDHDLDPIRTDRAFGELVAAARLIRATAEKK